MKKLWHKLIILLFLITNIQVYAGEIEIQPTMFSRSNAQDRIWVGSFQLVWNDFMDKIVHNPIRFREGTPRIVYELNQQSFTANDLSERSYYKYTGKVTKSTKRNIEKGIRKKFKPLKDYHFIKFNSILELGGKNDLINAISAGFIHNYIFNYLEWFFYHKKPYVDLKYKTIIIKDTNKLNYYCNLTVIFNLLMVVISLIKILMEKIIYAIRNKARQN